jgi:hypothetical protein
MTLKHKATLTFGACALAWMPVQASFEAVNMPSEAPVRVAGQSLRLNGVGVSSRLLFRIYAMGLYLPDRRESMQEIVSRDEPRRLVIRMLRDVDGETFNDMLMDYASSRRGETQPQVLGPMLHLARLIASQPQGLRNGDVLTFDWVPGTGTVVELNQKAVTEPLRGVNFYHALLDIWLGEKPADPGLKTQLLGRGDAVARTYH